MQARPLGTTGLDCHPFGFGCYRVANGNTEHEAALRHYLDRGGNLIDTSANYGDGASEELVAKVLPDYPREKVIVVTKGGYIQGQNMALAEQHKFPEIVHYGPGIWHCIHPEFLETQIDLSLARLQQDHVDVYLLHNPEYFLDDITHRRKLTPADHDEFYRRIAEAFRFLEEKVAEGRIGWYGVSSNNYGQPAFDVSQGSTTMTSVSRTLEQAQRLSPQHHFRVVQLPLNLYEGGGAMEKNNADETVLTFCSEHGLGVLANRPLNAFHRNQMIRLADWLQPGSAAPGSERLKELVEPLRHLEEKFTRSLDDRVQLAGNESMSELFLRVVPQVESISQWQQVAGQNVIDPIRAWIVQAGERFRQHPGWDAWQQDLVKALNTLLEEVQDFLATRQQDVSDQVRTKLLAAGYPAGDESLSRMALRVLAGLEGLSCVLVGMRKPRYVDDVLGAARREKLDSPSILARFS